MIVKKVLPIIAGLVAVALPVLADLIAILLPILALLTPIARRLLTAESFASGQPILERVAALLGRSIGQLALPFAQARQVALSITNAIANSGSGDGARANGRQGTDTGASADVGASGRQRRRPPSAGPTSSRAGADVGPIARQLRRPIANVGPIAANIRSVANVGSAATD
jgi:hypothetical protein